MPNECECNFEKTIEELQKCYRNLLMNSSLTREEIRYRIKLILLCKDIIDEFTVDSDKIPTSG